MMMTKMTHQKKLTIVLLASNQPEHMNMGQLHAFLANLRICLIIVLTIFINPHVWSNENSNSSSNFDKQLAHADSIRSSNPKQFLNLISKLNLDTFNKSKTQQYYLDYLNIYLLIYQGDLNKAITSAKVLIKSDANTLLKFRTKLSLVNTFANKQSWTEGLSTLSSVLKELPTIKDEKNHQLALIIASIFYIQLEQYHLGLIYAKKVELTSTQGRDHCIAKAQIIESSFKLKQLRPTDPIIKHAISLCRINKELLIISFINFYVAEQHIENQEPDKALAILNSSLQDTLNTKYPRAIAGYYSLIAQAHWLNGNAELTKQFALLALENEKKEGTTVAKVLSYKLLFELEQAAENFEAALLYHQQYAIADKLYYDETQAKHLAFQLAEHKNIEQKNKIDLLHEKNALLTSEKALLTAEQALTKANAENTRFIMLILLFSLSVLLFWGIRLLRAHKRIKQLAEYDALTGILNRGHFTQVANNALRYCESAEQELSIIMFDLDNFKNINDSYGHACGDWALKKTVEVCKKISRQNDIFVRLGGEEFCLLLPSCDKKAALKRAESCRYAIEKIATKESGFEFTITASFGISDAKTSGYKLDKLLADADCAAYAAKRAGRNQVTLYSAETAAAAIPAFR